MIDIEYRPIKVYPAEWTVAKERQRSAFDSTLTQTMRLLERELTQLGASNVTIQVGCRDNQITSYGQLKQQARLEHPGVIVSFDTKEHGTLTYATDRFTHTDDNLRAIALGLESLRRVERYGIADRGQQYAGYRELGSGIALGAAPMTREIAAKFLHDAAAPDSLEVPWERLLDAPELVTEAYRLGAKRLHPDHGGDEATFKRLVEARDVLVKAAS